MLIPKMIDTIKIKLPLTPINLLAIQNRAVQEMGAVGKGIKLFSRLSIPPENRTLTIIKDMDRQYSRKSSTNTNTHFYLEGSLPKIYYGENVSLLYPSQLPTLFKTIENALIEQYGDVPSWDKWEVQRLDIVYAWKFENQEKALEVLNFLEFLDYPRKKAKHIYDNETVIFGGRSYSVKFYLKKPEFLKHGFKELQDKGYPEIANEALNLANGVLRFEIKINKSKLVSLFNKSSIKTVDLLYLDWYYKIQNEVMAELLHNRNMISTLDNDAMSKLSSVYKKDKAMRLFLFWKTYYSKDIHIKKFLKKNHNPSTLLRNFKDLSNAGVGVPSGDFKTPYDFSIPNKNVVNAEFSFPVAPATEKD